jgi:RimK family alpha-L-glutamate ligase
MKRVAVLTASPELALHRELEAAGERHDCEVVTLDALRLAAQPHPPRIFLGGEELGLADLGAVLPRVGNWRPDSTLALLDVLVAAGVPALNEARAIRRGRDHYRTISALAGAGLPHPPTVAGSEPETLAAAAAAAFGFPCVVKQRRSRQGIGVILCQGRDQLEAVLDSLWRVGDEVIVQRFCPPGGVSRRALVLDGEVLGMTEHHARPGEFRANAARGGKVAAVADVEALAGLAVAAAAVVGLSFAGVDLLPDGDRWVIGEVNPTPGWRHFKASTSVPVADRVVEALVRLGGLA